MRSFLNSKRLERFKAGLKFVICLNVLPLLSFELFYSFLTKNVHFKSFAMFFIKRVKVQSLTSSVFKISTAESLTIFRKDINFHLFYHSFSEISMFNFDEGSK